MTSKIILSYRRSDSDVITGRIRDKLASYYGEDAVFMDIDSIPLGFDYREQIKHALLENKIFIAVIGPKWLGGKGKESRINEETDPVRIEVETALQQGTPVVPVLVSGATMPKASELPQSLRNLCYLNAAEVDGGRDFHQHMDRLIHAIDQILKLSEPPPIEQAPQPKQTPAPEQIPPREQTPSPGQAPSIQPAPSPRRKWIPVALGAVSGLLVTAIGIWAYALISRPIKVAAPPQPVVQQSSPPTAVTAIAPPPFSSADCKPESASFYDDFHKPDSGWNLASANLVHYADGQLVVTPGPNRTYAPIYLSLRYENVTICAHIKSPPQAQALDDTAGGVVFWVTNRENYYLAKILPNGSYSIQRRLGGTWITLVPPTKNALINSGPNAINEARIALVDNFGALFINNGKVTEFRGQPPGGGGAIGLSAESESTASDEWHFLDIAVMDNGKSKPVVLPPAPSGPTIADCRPVNAADFQDTFQKPDPGWGFGGPAAQYVGGQLLLKPNIGQYHVNLYRPLIFKNATVCVTVKSPLELADPSGDLAGGLAFWASDYKNFYEAAIYPNGTFDVSRKFNDEWVTVLSRTTSDRINKGIGAVNELQVVLNNNNFLLYINGAFVQQFRGQPPQDGGAVGVFAQSDSKLQSEWRFLNITVVENQ